LNLAIRDCRQAGFRKIVLRGDTDFSQTAYLDGWNDDGVDFVFGYDATPNLKAIAETLEENRWKPLQRDSTPSDKPRAKRDNFKRQIIIDNKYKNLEQVGETYAEFDYEPTKCKRGYRIVVVRKEIECSRGQLRLFEDDRVRYFFYITNASKSDLPARAVIRQANERPRSGKHDRPTEGQSLPDGTAGRLGK
jgi:hypothetical protein